MDAVTPSHRSGAQSKRPKVIGVLGGSFNPAHSGHLEISIAALEALPLNEVWWLISPANPLKDAANYAAYDVRVARARTVANDPRIVVSDFENTHCLQYTVDTLEALKQHNPDKRFVWLMGADSLASFHLWKDWESITERVPIAVFSRPGDETAGETSIAAQKLSSFEVEFENAAAIVDKDPPAWVFVPTTNNSMSSTALRSAASKASRKTR
ncbi:MAG: nicotinate-nucleotide adenylyltransferase [Pseudomonadota bacterium]